MRNPADIPFANAERIIFGSHLIYLDHRVVMLTIENHFAARFWSEGTQWCIDSKSWFEEYRKDGFLILFRLIKENRKYLLSPAGCEFRNPRNRRISMPAFIERFPKIEPYIREKFRNDWRALFYFNLATQKMYFDHSLNLKSLSLHKIPDNLNVRDDLDLSDNPISKLPENLFVGGVLNIRNTNITELPSSAHIRGKILW